MRRAAPALVGIAFAFAVSACGSASGTQGRPDALPADPASCSTMSPKPSPDGLPPSRWVPWRAEQLPDGSVRMIIGDVDAAPRDRDAVRTVDYQAPYDPDECVNVKIVKVHGWWCVTTVQATAETGAIVVNGASPSATLHAGGFTTTCEGRRPGEMRQTYQIQRDSWSGWRPYGGSGTTPWTTAQGQMGGRVTSPCPTGRVGSYYYRLWVQVSIEGVPVGQSLAGGSPVRSSCGTGIS